MVKRYRCEWIDKDTAWLMESPDDRVIAKGSRAKMEQLLASLKSTKGFNGKTPDFFLAKDFN